MFSGEKHPSQCAQNASSVWAFFPLFLWFLLEEMKCRGEHLNKPCAGTSRDFTPSLCIAGYRFTQSLLDLSWSMGNFIQCTESRKSKQILVPSVISCGEKFFDVLSSTILRYGQEINISFLSLHTVSPLSSAINVMSASCLALSIKKFKAHDNTETEERNKMLADCSRAESWSGAVSW